MTKIAALLLLLATGLDVLAESVHTFSGGISLAHNYGYQGINQDEGATTISVNAQYQLTDHFTVGAWAGEYDSPRYSNSTREIDYFVGYSKRLSFEHRVESVIWHYTFLDDAYERYDSTQWLTSYHIDERFTVTVGVSDNLLGLDELTTFAEGSARHTFGPLTVLFGLGRNNMSRTFMDSFEYARVQAIYGGRHWALSVDYTKPRDSRNVVTRALAQDGLGASLTYRFRR